MAQSFLRYFEVEPIAAGRRDYTCPPKTPRLQLTLDESKANYKTLESNVANGYGMTALMAMTSFDVSNCYKVPFGTIFLFPGIDQDSPPVYQGTVKIKCEVHDPLRKVSTGNTLHRQMCDLLGQPTTTFIGFAVSYPWNGEGRIGYNSGTCNPYWFGGNRTIPTDCRGVNWQKIIYGRLEVLLT